MLTGFGKYKIHFSSKHDNWWSVLALHKNIFSSPYRVINVPIPDDNIAKVVNTLPRTESNSGMVNIKLKRKMSMKNYHKFGMINPSRMYESTRLHLANTLSRTNNRPLLHIRKYKSQFDQTLTLLFRP